MSLISKEVSAKKNVNGHSQKNVKSKVNTLESILNPLSHYRACKRGVARFDGIDAHGKNKVLPPSFEGVKKLVQRVGEDFAKAQFTTEPESPEANLPKDTLRDFLNELQFADNVERQTMIREFSEYVGQLEEQLTASSEPQPELEPQPESPQDSQR